MDLTREVGKRFAIASRKSDRRLSHGSRFKSKVRRGERTDPSERLMDKILKASRPKELAKSKGSQEEPVSLKKEQDPIKPVPKVSSNG